MPRGSKVTIILSVAAMATTSLLGIPTNAMAATHKCQPHGLAHNKKADVITVTEYVTHAQASGEDPADIERTLISDWCLTKISSDDEVSTSSTQADVNWYYASMYYESDYGYYLAVADWIWLNNHFLDNDTVICTDNEVGGNDGVAIRFSGGEYHIISKSAVANGNSAVNSYYYDYGVMTVPSSSTSQYGVGFTAQDKARKLEDVYGTCLSAYDYNMYEGGMTIGFEALNGSCRTAQMFMDYIHTWTDTEVTSLGASADGFSIGWSNSGNSWQNSDSGPTATIC